MNMKNKILISGVFLLLSGFVFAQDFENYKELSSDGTIPMDFITLANDKFEQDKTKISEDEQRHKRKVKEQFYLESNFSISEFLKSGNVLFNDPVSNYLNEIYNNIKLSNSFLNDEDLRFYTCKSTIINAYATHAGIIFINIGLVAKIKTEDELAYIMCHEISHYIEDHSINQYTYNDEIDSNKGSYRRTSWEKKMFSKANYSQQHELIADSLGLIMYSNTNYCINSPVEALGNLKTYNSPFSKVLDIQKSFFESSNISFPDINIVPLDSIEVEKYDDDNNSTHPDIDERMEEIADQLSQPEYDVDSIKTKTLPNKFQKLAQFEMPHLYLEKGMTIHALYCVMSLLEENPDNKYLNGMLCNILYAISQNSTCLKNYPDRDEIADFKHSQRDYHKDLKYSCADMQQLYLFLNKMSNEQKNSLAIVKLLAFISDNNVGDSDAMMLRLRDLTKMNLSYYSDSKPIKNLIERDSVFAGIYNDEKQISRSEIKKLRNSYREEDESKSIIVSTRIIKNSSIDKTDDVASGEENGEVTESKESLSEEEETAETGTSKDVNTNTGSDKNEKKDKKEKKLKAEPDRILFVTPEFRKFDLRKNQAYKFQASEKALNSYQKKIEDNADLLEIDHVMLSTLNMGAADVEQINDISLINTFVDEHNNNSPWTMSSKKEEIQNLISKYNTDKIVFVGTYSFHMSRDVGSEIYMVFISLFLPPAIPFAIWHAITPEFRTFTYVLLYNLSTEKVDYYEVEYMKMNGNEGVVNTTMYYSFMKIKNL